MADENTPSRGDWPIQSKHRSTVAALTRFAYLGLRVELHDAGRGAADQQGVGVRLERLLQRGALLQLQRLVALPLLLLPDHAGTATQSARHGLVAVEQFTYVSCVV